MTTRKNVIHVKSPTPTELIQVIGKVGSPSERKKLLNMLPAGTRVKIFNQMAKEDSPRSLALKLNRVSPKARSNLMKMLPAGTRAKINAIVRKPVVKLTPTLRTFATNLKANYIRRHPTPPRLSENAQENYRVERNIRAWKNALAQINAGSRPANTGSVQRRASPPKQFSTSYKAQLRSFYQMTVPELEIHANGMGVGVNLLYEMMNANYQNKSGRVAPTHVKNKRPKVKGGIRALVSGKRRLAKTSAMKY
jgi:hypothetical protein